MSEKEPEIIPPVKVKLPEPFERDRLEKIKAQVTSQDYVDQFNKEVVNLKADITSMKTKLSVDKSNKELKNQIKQKTADLKTAQKNLKTAKN